VCKRRGRQSRRAETASRKTLPLMTVFTFRSKIESTCVSQGKSHSYYAWDSLSRAIDCHLEVEVFRQLGLTFRSEGGQMGGREGNRKGSNRRVDTEMERNPRHVAMGGKTSPKPTGNATEGRAQNPGLRVQDLKWLQ
jgi:hypothetical protein